MTQTTVHLIHVSMEPHVVTVLIATYATAQKGLWGSAVRPMSLNVCLDLVRITALV